MEKAKVWLRQDGILQIDLSGIKHLKLPIMEDIYQQHIAISQEKLQILFTGGSILGYDKEAVSYVSSAKVCALTSSAAILTHSKLEQYLGRMFLWYTPPPFPVKLFSNEEDAINWLKMLNSAKSNIA